MRLVLTICPKEDLHYTIHNIQTIIDISNKIYILDIKEDPEHYAITYNVEQYIDLPLNSFLVHMNRQTKTIYTINALNQLIARLNNGVVDTSMKIEWMHYRNCILLTKNGELNTLHTSLYKMI